MNKIKFLQCTLVTIVLLTTPFITAKTFAQQSVYKNYDNSILSKTAVKPVKINWKKLQHQSNLLDKYVTSRRGNFDNTKIPSHLRIKLPDGLIYNSRHKNDASFANILRRTGGESIILHGVMDKGVYSYLAVTAGGILYQIETNGRAYPATGMDDANYMELTNLTIDKIVKQNSKFYFYTAKGVYLIDVNQRSVSKAVKYPKI
ncbi:hypothetical protein DSM106972_096600 [Dulcicalothrix desertica PCC 7102]|uniref:Uncharacterized protein n=1 Tax=Dulcicalothrix desertica PCC 7102 TaxID=232991 RepID=A0A433UHM6_9CYAN|nr:hypothetical protein [Dulcicalothrix desertica]RUS93304.1 hypothetical protein DSM106972_096600 [Dulcicalothrix desertica PCC 7102]TWH62762.1 hypothetical protein CAL7102_00285 [Dulcicalothrix desertica PCC 7102]